MKEKTVKEVRNIVSKMKVFKRGTKEGDLQREAFRIRWGKKPEDL